MNIENAITCHNGAIENKDIFREFVEKNIVPYAQDFDLQQCISPSSIELLGKHGYFGASIPKKYSGKEYNYATLGILHEEFAKGSCSIENALTVCGMVCKPLIKFGTQAQKENWLPKIANGKIIAAFALTEPLFGSDIKNLKTNITSKNNQYILNGNKTYITLGQIADLFLVIANHNGLPTACLLERNTPGLHITPIKNLLGFRANMLAELQFEECVVQGDNILGKIGNGVSHIAACALDEGRFTTAFGCVGLAQACLETALSYSNARVQSSDKIKEHQLIKKMLTEIIVNVKVAREFCLSTGILRDQKDTSYISQTLIAKYFASKMVNTVSSHTVQILGAMGCLEENKVARYFRDAKIMEIIEGTSQIHEILIPEVYME